jgi:TfoX/Sxy family transcriptional regulator of competence genes
MEIAKPTEDDRARFASLVPDSPFVEVKPMFGNVAAFVNGNMFMGLFGSALGIKLGDADRQALVAAGGGPFGPAGRPMGGYVTLPTSLAQAETVAWIDRALAHVASLPPKAAKPKPRK